MDLNLNSLTTDDKGRVSFSGLGSKIDFKGAVDAIIAAKRIPVDRLETKITGNTDKITAFQDFRSLLNGLRESLKNLHGAVSIDASRNIFEAKQAFASASRTDGAAASSPADIVGVTVTNQAAAQAHTIEVVQTATAHKVGSGSFSSASSDIGTARGLPANSIAGTIEIAGRQIQVLGTDTLADLAGRINNANSGANATGLSASIVQISATQHFLVLNAAETGKTIGTDIALVDPDGVLQQLGVLTGGGGFANELQAARTAQFYADGVLDPDTGQPLLIERQGNTITDLFKGVTINLFKAEPGTTVKIDVERNLGQVKTAIDGFVTAYNEARTFLNMQLDTDPSTGQPHEDAVLFGSRALADIESKLSQIVGGGVSGVDEAASVLAQIGITFVNNNTLSDPLLANTLQIDSEKLDAALISRTDDVRKLFAFDFASSDPRVSLLGFAGTAAHSPAGYTLDVDFDEVGNRIASATVDGIAARVDGKRIIVEEGPAKGLTLFYSGNSDAAGIQLDFTVGLGARTFFALDDALDPTRGAVETEIRSLTTQNESGQKRIDEMLVRIEIQRDNLLARFINMEAALASMNSILESVTQMTEAMFAKK